MKKIIVAVLCLCLTAGLVYAGTEAGKMEIGGSASLTIPGSDYGPDWQATVMGVGGYFVTAALQVQGLVLLSGDSDTLMGFLGAGLDYHFLTAGDTVPYVGASAMTDVGDNAQNDIYMDVHGGVKKFVSENTSVNATLSYRAMMDYLDEGNIEARIGFSYYL